MAEQKEDQKKAMDDLRKGMGDLKDEIVDLKEEIKGGECGILRFSNTTNAPLANLNFFLQIDDFIFQIAHAFSQLSHCFLLIFLHGFLLLGHVLESAKKLVEAKGD